MAEASGRKVDIVDDFGDPDDEGCLWFTVASVTVGAPGISAQVIRETFRRLAEAHDGVKIGENAPY